MKFSQLASLFLFAVLALSCTDTVTYADSLAAENSQIDDFIKRKGIQLTTTFPTDTSYWRKNPTVYFKSASGLYFRMIKTGSGGSADTLRSLDRIGARYKAYTLAAIGDTTINNISTSNYPNPTEFNFGSGEYTNVCFAFNEAAAYMKRNDSEALLIVPSKIGFSADAAVIRPMGYRFILNFHR